MYEGDSGPVEKRNYVSCLENDVQSVNKTIKHG